MHETSTPANTAILVAVQRSHVDEDMAVAAVPVAPVDEFFSMFSSNEA